MIDMQFDGRDLEKLIATLSGGGSQQPSPSPPRPGAGTGKKDKHVLWFENSAPYASFVQAREGFFVINLEYCNTVAERELKRLANPRSRVYGWNSENIQKRLDEIGEHLYKWHTQMIGDARRGRWRDRTGTLANSYRWSVDKGSWKKA